MADLMLHVDAQYTSPYAMSVFVALHEKGLPFDLHAVDLGAGAHLAPSFAAASLTSRVPLLEHAGFALSESSAIVEYLEEVFPGAPAVLPADYAACQWARPSVQRWLALERPPL